MKGTRDAMRVFDFDGTIYDGESLFDLYMFSARYEPKVLRHLAPVLRYAVQYKMGRATLAQMERGVGGVTCDYLHDVAASRRIRDWAARLLMPVSPGRPRSQRAYPRW